MNKDIFKKTVVVGIVLFLVIVIFIPSVNSQFGSIFSGSIVQKEHEKNGSREFINNLDSNSVFESKLRVEEATNHLPFETENWWNDSWSYRKNVTIDYTKVDDDFINFPVLISLPYDDDLASKAQDNGNDIVFTDYSGDKLNHEIELFNGITGELVAWVNLTSVSSNVNTTLSMYYGNPSAANQENVAGTWDSGFIMVHHMNDNTTSSIADSTSNHYDGAKAGVNTPNETTGFIGNAQWFDGFNDYIDTVDYDFTEAMAYSFWVNIHSNTSQHNYQQFLSKSFAQVFSCFFSNPSNKLAWSLRLNGSNKEKNYENQPKGYWCFVAFSFDNATANNNFNCYHNNTLHATDTYHGSIGTNNAVIYIGCGEGHNYRANATIDEVRISKVARSPAWFKTEYNNQNDPNTFYSISSEEESNKPPHMPSDPYPANGSTNVNINVDLSWTGGDPDGDPVTYDVYFGTSSTPPKVASNQTATTYDPGTIDLEKTYYWKIIAWDDQSAFTEGPIWWFSTGTNQPPSKPIILSAPTFGKPGTQLDFSTVAIDPEGDQIYYMWDWGDGELSGWLGPFVSGQTTEAHHAWDESGEFEVKVKAKDSNNAESYWSEPVQITIENNPPDVEITQPLTNVLYLGNRPFLPFFATLIIGSIDIIVNASDDLSGMDRVEFFIKDSLKKTDTSAPYVWLWKDITFGLKAYDIKVIAYDNAGNHANDTIMVWKFF